MEGENNLDVRKNIQVQANRNNWIWSNRKSPITYLPMFLENEILYRLPHSAIVTGTKFYVTTHWPSDIYIARKKGETCGWTDESLRNYGWEPCLDDALNNGRLAFVRVKIFEHEHRNFLCFNYRVYKSPTEIEFELWRKKVAKNPKTSFPEIIVDQSDSYIQSAAAIFVVEGKNILNPNQLL